MHARQGIQSTFVSSFSKNVFYPNKTFLRLDFSLVSRRGFDNTYKGSFLNFSFLRTCITICNYHFTNITNASPQSCFFFKDFKG